MKKILLFFFLVPSSLFGQELDSLVIDTLAIDSVVMDTLLADSLPKTYWAVSVDVDYLWAPNPQGYEVLAGIGGAVDYKKISFGLMAYEFKGEFSSKIIFPNDFIFNYRYAEASFKYLVIQTPSIDSWFMLSYGQGEAKWAYAESNEIFEKDSFGLVKFGGVIELSKVRFIRPFLKFGYQKMVSLDLKNVVNRDFADFFLGIGVRLGYFNI